MRARGEDGAVRFYAVPLFENGNPKPNLAIIKDTQTGCSGPYVLDWTEDGKRRRRVVGDNPKQAARERRKQEALLNAVNSGIEVAAKDENGRQLLADCSGDFLEETKRTKKPKAF